MKNHVFFFLPLFFLFSCSENETPEIVNPGPVVVTCDFTPEIVAYDFFIEGFLCDKLIRYPQVNRDNINTSNKYFTGYQETWLQAFIDTTAEVGYWTIRIHDTDIENIELPYTLNLDQGRVFWYDPRVDDMIESIDLCQGLDSACAFSMTAGENENVITITSVEDQIIEGEFSGRAIVRGTQSTPYQDTTSYYDISDGKFRIMYRTE
ncbi:MAG: hypothetical protein AAFZ15_04105 [Bacteroidota bacterium]